MFENIGQNLRITRRQVSIQSKVEFKKEESVLRKLNFSYWLYTKFYSIDFVDLEAFLPNKSSIHLNKLLLKWPHWKFTKLFQRGCPWPGRDQNTSLNCGPFSPETSLWWPIHHCWFLNWSKGIPTLLSPTNEVNNAGVETFGESEFQNQNGTLTFEMEVCWIFLKWILAEAPKGLQSCWLTWGIVGQLLLRKKNKSVHSSFMTQTKTEQKNMESPTKDVFWAPGNKTRGNVAIGPGFKLCYHLLVTGTTSGKLLFCKTRM